MVACACMVAHAACAYHAAALVEDLVHAALDHTLVTDLVVARLALHVSNNQSIIALHRCCTGKRHIEC
jgi:hypothetical protein